MAKITIAAHEHIGNFPVPPAFARVYCDRPFLNDDGDTVQNGAIRSGNYVKQVEAAYSAGVTTIAAFDGSNQLDSTVPDGATREEAFYALTLHDTDGNYLATVFEEIKVPSSPTTTSWAELSIVSGIRPVPYRYSYPTLADVQSLVALMALANLVDTQITSPANNDLLAYDSILGKWKNSAASGYITTAAANAAFAPATPFNYSYGRVIDQLINAAGTSRFINCGSGTTYGRWVGDTGLYSAGTGYDTGNSGWQANTPLRPMMSQNGQVYQYLRFHTSTITYTLSGFAPFQPCLVRIHTGDTGGLGAAVKQSITINGTTVQATYTAATDAGGNYMIGIKEFTVNASSSGQLVIAFVPSGGFDAAVSAIEVQQPVPLGCRTIHVAGDSITAGGGPIAITDTWPYQLAELYNGNLAQINGTTYDRGYDEKAKRILHMAARSGDTIPTQQTIAGTNINPFKSTLNEKEIVFLNCGVNDILAGASSATVQSRLTSYFASLTSGFTKGIGTITPSTSLSAGQETIRQAVNTWIKANSLALDFVVDWETLDSRLANAANATYFYDGLHNTRAGYTIRAGLMRTALEAL